MKNKIGSKIEIIKITSLSLEDGFKKLEDVIKDEIKDNKLDDSLDEEFLKYFVAFQKRSYYFGARLAIEMIRFISESSAIQFKDKGQLQLDLLNECKKFFEKNF
jgi:hypothetical protein